MSGPVRLLSRRLFPLICAIAGALALTSMTASTSLAFPEPVPVPCGISDVQRMTAADASCQPFTLKLIDKPGDATKWALGELDNIHGVKYEAKLIPDGKGNGEYGIDITLTDIDPDKTACVVSGAYVPSNTGFFTGLELRGDGKYHVVAVIDETKFTQAPRQQGFRITLSCAPKK